MLLFSATFFSVRIALILALICELACPASLTQAAETLFKADGSCSRTFVYRNRTHPLDSSRKLDGEGLRTMLKNAPQSEALLNDYQASLKSSKIPAYTATLGIALAIGGPIYGNTLDSHLGQRDTRYAFLLSGLFIAVASYAYAQYAIVKKEKTLEKAINTYNDAVPETDRIRVDLGPLRNETGGEIKTQVPF